ncbi:YncE family protein [Mucilaginibacter sp. KACC 22063]|uniref:YncE family protein n=1 Tax=Mucilaginibacter sp. KACC 22063 TaxID=3025666 RepID=UPI0023660592|nr:DUF5074 domain-containing protein [Mucilaginibacter sp. KACC 22063]WDF53524.1 YncE family protein [Mucilaginibacter sp. KACC 22063]
MKKISIKQLLIAFAATALLSACHKDKNDPTPDTPGSQRAGVYILNQGNFGGNNGSLTYYDYTSKNLTADIFSSVNGKGLGDTPNDIKIYGSKMYITVNVSSTVEVLNPKTGKEIKQIAFTNGTTNRQPRSIAFYKGNAFITSYDGTVAVLDTATLTVSKYITVGRNPEQMVVSNNKLYVANSGGLSFGNPDKTVSVVDLTTLTETKKITVIANPVSMAADAYGHVYVVSTGDYNTILPGLSIIDNTTDAVTSQNSVNFGYGSPIIVNGDIAYYFTSDNKVATISTKTPTSAPASFISDGTTFTAAYGLNVDTSTGEVFVTDALDYKSKGNLVAFDKNGKKEYVLTVGINPGAVTFVNK